MTAVGRRSIWIFIGAVYDHPATSIDNLPD